MQLKVLPHRNVRHAARVPLGNIRDTPQLLTPQNSIRDPDAHHKKRRRLPFAVRAADHSLPVALRVNSPRAKIRPQPFRRNRSMPLPRKFANLVNALPRILGSLESLDTLCFGFLVLAHKKMSPIKNGPQKQKTHQPVFLAGGLGNLKLDYDLSSKSPIARQVRHTTCATSAWTTPHLATIQHKQHLTG